MSDIDITERHPALSAFVSHLLDLGYREARHAEGPLTHFISYLHAQTGKRAAIEVYTNADGVPTGFEVYTNVAENSVPAAVEKLRAALEA